MNAAIQEERVANAGAAKRLSIGQFGFAAVLYVVLAILFTWPAAIRPYTTVVGDADVLGGIWWVWARLNGLIDLFGCTKLIAWPDGVCGPMPSQPVSEYLVLLFSRLTDEIVGTTLFIAFSLVSSALTAFVVLARRGITPLAASWGGALVGFNAPALAQVLGGHAVYALAVPVILLLDKLEKIWSAQSISPFARSDQFKETSKGGMLLGLWLGLTFAVSIYSGYFLSVLVSIVGVGALVRAIAIATVAREKKKSETTSIEMSFIWLAVTPYFLSLFVAAVIALACNALLVAHYFGLLPAYMLHSEGFFSRSYSELAGYGARPLDYLRPFPWHPLWGDIFNIQRLLPPLRGNAYEMSLFPGLIVLVLVGAGVVRYRKIEAEDPLRGLFRSAAVFTLIMLLLSFATEISMGGVFDLPVVSQFLYPFAPMFRVYARCGIFVAVGLGVIAAISVNWHLKLFPLRNRLLAGLLLVFVFFGSIESFPANLGRATSTTEVRPPSEIVGISKLGPRSVVVHFPMYKADELGHYRYLFWQRIHRKPMLNGASSTRLSSVLPSQFSSVPDNATQELLRSLGATHLILHSDFDPSEPIPPAILLLFPKSTFVENSNLVGGHPPKRGLIRIIPLQYPDDLR